MYLIEKMNKKYTPYNHKIEIYQKINNIITCYENGIKNVLYITRNVYNQSVRYRVDHMLELTDEMNEWNGTSIETINLDMINPYLEMISVIILQRTYYTEVKELIEIAKRRKIPIGFEIDDYVFSDKCVKAAVSATSTDIQARTEMVNEYYLAEQECDFFLTTNGYLEKELYSLFERNVYIIPNFCNKAQMQVIDEYIRQKTMLNIYKDKFVLGYFCGSRGHDKDFNIIFTQIRDFMQKHENVYLKIVGFLNIPEELKEFKDENRIEILEFMDCCDLLKEIAEVDLNLIPLDDNPFSNARSEIKYFEAAMVGTVSCMSQTYIYKQLVKDGKLGFMCPDDGWLKMFEKLYLERDNLKKNMQRLHDEAKEKYNYKNQIKRLNEVLDKIIA